MSADQDLPESAAGQTHDEMSAGGASSTFMRSPLSVGKRWREYQIGDQIETEQGWCYSAVDSGQLHNVEVRVYPANELAVIRAQAWRELQSLEMPGLHKGVDAFEDEGFRFEISQAVPKVTLREWVSSRQASLDEVQVLVQQVSDMLIAMHDRGIVHLNLRPDTIYVLSAEGALRVMLGGLEFVTTYNQAGLIPVPVDPFYAPPEAAGLSKHSPGAALRAWDWWTLGRIVQELVLGRHVLGVVFNRDVSKPTPELRARAENHLLERDPQAPRAGAVEVMPPMNQRLTDLLRGLLSSSRSGRWGTDEVIRWLRQEPVRDRYRLGRNEELFAWKDRVFTIDEAAEFFVCEENWADGEANLFDRDDSMTLISFLMERPAYRQFRERIDELQEFMEIPAWSGLPAQVRKEAITSAAWLLLGGEDAKLTLRGKRVDAVCIRGLLSMGSVEDAVDLVKAYIALPFIQMIEHADPDAARLFSSLDSTVSGEAVTRAVAEGWLNLEGAADFSKLLLMAMEQERTLLDLCAGLQGTYACSRVNHVDHLLRLTKRSRSDLVLLAYTAAQPERYGFITHADWKRERFEELKKRGEKLVVGLFWLRLGQAEKAGYLIYGRREIVLGLWICVALAAGWSSGWGLLPLWVVGVVAVGVVLRYLSALWLTFLIRRGNPQAARWAFSPESGRCQRETVAALEGESVPLTAAAISGEFSALQAEIAGLELAPAPLPRAGGFLPAWLGTLAGWGVVIALLVVGHWRYFQLVPVPSSEEPSTAAMAIEKAMASAPVDEKLTVEERFFGDPLKPQARWNFAKPAQAPAVPLAKVKPAGADEVAAALIDGQRLLLSFKQSSVDAIIAVPVGDKSGAGLMLYDGRNRRVIGRQVLLPSQLPSEKSWFEVDKLKVFYVGAPSPAPAPPPKPIVDPFVPVDTSDLPEREVRRGAYQNVAPVAEQKPTNAQPLSDALDTMTP